MDGLATNDWKMYKQCDKVSIDNMYLSHISFPFLQICQIANGKVLEQRISYAFQLRSKIFDLIDESVVLFNVEHLFLRPTVELFGVDTFPGGWILETLQKIWKMSDWGKGCKCAPLNISKSSYDWFSTFIIDTRLFSVKIIPKSSDNRRIGGEIGDGLHDVPRILPPRQPSEQAWKIEILHKILGKKEKKTNKCFELSILSCFHEIFLKHSKFFVAYLSALHKLQIQPTWPYPCGLHTPVRSSSSLRVTASEASRRSPTEGEVAFHAIICIRRHIEPRGAKRRWHAGHRVDGVWKVLEILQTKGWRRLTYHCRRACGRFSELWHCRIGRWDEAETSRIGGGARWKCKSPASRRLQQIGVLLGNLSEKRIENNENWQYWTNFVSFWC